MGFNTMKNLTVTEQAIYDWLLKDKTEKEISEELHVSKHTVKSYINMINRRLDLIK